MKGIKEREAALKARVQEFLNLKEISADELMERLGTSDYVDMMKMVQEKFSGKTAFDSLREYLESEKIGYKYAMETRPGVMDEE